jgi:simple sugar transport system permease protein
MSTLVDKSKVPWWVANVIVPLVNLIVALIVSGLFIYIAGANPFKAVQLIIYGSFGYIEGFAYTLYYTTNFIFTGLAFAVAFHCRLFNIGGEGQAYLGGLGVFLIAINFSFLPVPIVWLLAIIASALFGAAWAFIPAYLQAYRGSHVVITTIMFNFIASSLMVFLLVDVIRDTNQMGPQTASLIKEQWFPMLKDIGLLFGIKIRYSPLNISFFLAILALFFVWFLIWRTKWGYEMRAVGHNTRAAVYAGISPHKNIIIAMLISGALAGMLGVNEVLGVHHRVIVNFPAGYGFTGIAVALMGRNHPIGIFLAAFLFGILYQGGSEVTFDMPKITRYMFVAVQGVIILFSGALENLFRPQIESFFVKRLNNAKVA